MRERMRETDRQTDAQNRHCSVNLGKPSEEQTESRHTLLQYNAQFLTKKIRCEKQKSVTHTWERK